jgi:gamma-polyglutamate biosynthesis protein CapA
MNNNSIRFSAVGDVTLGDHPLCVGFGAYSRFREKDVLFPFLKVLRVLQRSELLFGNLECAHSGVGLRRGDLNSVQMRGDERHIEALAQAGFKVVNVANNHSVQHGTDAFLDTVKQLRKSNIACCGLAADEKATRAKAAIHNQNGLSVGFLGYSLRPRQYFEYVPPYAEGHLDSMLEDVRQLKEKVHAVVVSVHWGEEFIQRPSPEEVKMARLLVDAGADLIIGHHPHVLRGVERYRKGYIVYSLGNFVCDMVWDDTLRTSLIFECLITSAGIQDVNFVPTYTNEHYQPEVLGGEKAHAVFQRLDELAQEIEDVRSEELALASQRYLQDADTVHRHIRSKSQRFFLSSFWKCPVPILLQQLLTYARNRIHERVVHA